MCLGALCAVQNASMNPARSRYRDLNHVGVHFLRDVRPSQWSALGLRGRFHGCNVSATAAQGPSAPGRWGSQIARWPSLGDLKDGPRSPATPDCRTVGWRERLVRLALNPPPVTNVTDRPHPGAHLERLAVAPQARTETSQSFKTKMGPFDSPSNSLKTCPDGLKLETGSELCG